MKKKKVPILKDLKVQNRIRTKQTLPNSKTSWKLKRVPISEALAKQITTMEYYAAIKKVTLVILC